MLLPALDGVVANAAVELDEALADDAIACFLNLCCDAAARAQLRDDGAVASLVATLEAFSGQPQLARAMLLCLTRLALDDAASAEIASTGARLLIKTIEINLDDPVHLALTFDLLLQIGFVKANLKTLVQFGAMKVILFAMESHADDAELMIKATRCLDNMVSGEPENAELLHEAGGEARLGAVRREHARDAELCRAVASALLTIDAMRKLREEEGNRVNRAYLYRRLGERVELQDGTAVLNVQELTPEEAAFLASGERARARALGGRHRSERISPFLPRSPSFRRRPAQAAAPAARIGRRVQALLRRARESRHAPRADLERLGLLRRA